MINFKNSVISKFLQVLLIVYFLVSSINISNTFNEIINQNSKVDSTKWIVCNILKKIFNYDGCPEEIEELETQTKAGKGLYLIDFIVPGNEYLSDENFNMVSKDQIFSSNLYFVISPHTKIHLPPPEYLL